MAVAPIEAIDRDRVTLAINGKLYNYWLDESVCAGISRFARDFKMSITREWPEGLGELKGIREGDKVEVRIGDDLVATCYVDATPISYDESSISIDIEGRSKTSDLIDCSATNKPAQWKGATIAAIVKALSAEYSVDVVVDFDDKEVIKEFQFERGDSPFDAIDKLRKQRNLIICDDAEGRVVIAKIGQYKADDKLELGKNIKRASCPKDFKDVFNEYIVIGQKSGDGKSNAKEHNSETKETDTVFKRKRVLYIKQSGNADMRACTDRAKYERQSRFAKAHEVTLTVRGWRQTSGELWKPNMIVQYVDPVLGFEREMLIVECEYRVSTSGTETVMKIGLPDGYSAEPYVEKEAKDKAKKSSDKKPSSNARKGRAQGKGAWSDVVGIDEVDE